MSISRGLENFQGGGELVKRLLSSGAGYQGSESNVVALRIGGLRRCCRYRVFAELLELAQQHNLRIITPPPTFPTLESSAASQSLSYLATPISSQNPTQILQHPAYYYYEAACGTLKRQERFKEALDAEVSRTLLFSRQLLISAERMMQWGLKLQKRVDMSPPLLQDLQMKRKSITRL